ncbi:MAG: hypothetical protein V7695_24270 [Sulfitobacter sp.]
MTFNRRPVNITDVKGVIHFNTLPWQTIEQFYEYREAFESWRKNKKRVLRIAEDWKDFIEHKQLVARKADAGVRASNRPPIVTLFLKCYAHGELGLPGNNFKAASDFVTECGWETTVQNVKDSKRRGVLKLGSIDQFSEAEIEFLRKAKERWPDFDYAGLLSAM